MEKVIRERIKLKADELYYKYGIKSVTMDEIASQLGISKKTIYLSYKDKDELVDEVISDIIIRNQHFCENAGAKARDAIHESFLAMEMMQQMYENLNPLILFDLERNFPKTFNKFRDYKFNFLYDSIIKNLESGKKEGLYRENINNEVTAKIRLENMMLPFNQDIFPKNKFNLTLLQSELIIMYLFSIVTLKGYKLILKYQAQSIKKV